MTYFYIFSTCFLACFLAGFVLDCIKESVETNTPLVLRLQNEKYNFLANIYKDIQSARLMLMKDEDIFNMVNEKFKNRGYRFQLSNSTSKRYLDSLSFVESVLSDKTLLFGYVATPSFDRKEFNRLSERVGYDEMYKEARANIQYILKDKSNKSIDAAMIWLRKYLTTFVRDPYDETRRIHATENAFTIFYYGLDNYFDKNTKPKDFLRAITSLKKLYPEIDIPTTISHSSDWSCERKENRERGPYIARLIREEIDKTTR